MEKICLALTSRNECIVDAFQDFDPLRSGTVTVEQFRRCLKVRRVHDVMSPGELDAIVQHYYVYKNGTHMVDYKRFLEDLDAREAPEASLSPCRGIVSHLGDDDEKLLEQNYRLFIEQIRARGLDLKSLFKDFDVHCVGKVTESQFKRCFPFLNNPEVLDMICRKYRDSNGLIAYKNWCTEVMGLSLFPPRATLNGCPERENTYTGGFGRHDVQTLIMEIRNQFATNRLRCDDYMRDYDHLNSGLLPPHQFAAALGRVRFLRFQLNQEDIDTLCEHYAVLDKVDSKKVNYAEFLRDVMPRPTQATAMSQIFGTPFDQEESVRLDLVLRKVAHLIKTQRMNLRPTFHDFDRAVRKGTYKSRMCTKSHFERCLVTNNIRLSPAEISFLERRYATTGPDGEDGYFNYIAFCRDVDALPSEVSANSLSTPACGVYTRVVPQLSEVPESASPVMTITSHNSAIPGISLATAIDAEDMSLEGILNRLKHTAITHRICLAEFVRDGDPLRSGIITKEKLLSAIASSKITLQPREMEIIADHYAARVPGYVDIDRFLADVDYGAEVQHPQQQPLDREQQTMDYVRATRGDYARRCVGDPMSSQMCIAFARVRENISARGVLLPPFFKDYDRNNRGRITKSQFHTAISRYKLPLTLEEIEMFRAYYEDPENPNLVRYRDFIGDVDDSENVELQLSRRLEARQVKSPYSPSRNADGNSRSPRGSPNKSAQGTEAESEVGLSRSGSPDSGPAACTTERGRTVTDPLALATLQKIADFVLHRNVRLHEFFPDGDTLKKGYVTQHRFRHAIDILGIGLTEQEMEALENAFSSSTEADGIEYQEFLAAVKGIKGIPQSPSMFKTATVNRDVVQDKLLDSIVTKAARAFSSRRVNARQVFQEYDKLHKGRVSEGRFFTALLSVAMQMTPAEMNILKQSYCIGGGEMTYGEFVSRIDERTKINW